MEKSVPKRQAYQLPKVEAPSLQDLRVQLVAPLPPTADDLIERLHVRLRASAPRREREAGEAIEMGDEVECDIITVVNGHVLPGSVKSAARLEMREVLSLPGLLDQFLSMTTFSAKTFELTLPLDYPVSQVAGQKATFYVEARRVFQVDSVDLEDEQALKAAGLGDSLPEAMDVIAAEIDAEQGEDLLVQATQTVLGALARRVGQEIPAAAVDEELRQLWQQTEGVVLSQKKLPSEMVAHAEADFLKNPSLRYQAEERIRIGLALGALVEQEGLAPTAETMTMLLETAAEGAGVSLEQAKASLQAEPVYALQAGQTALYLNAVEWVMSRAVVDVLDPPEPEEKEPGTLVS